MFYLKNQILSAYWLWITLLLSLLFWQVNSRADSPRLSTSQPTSEHSMAAAASSRNTFVFTGQIIYVKVEGGFYAIQTLDGKKYKPLNLPLALHVADKWVTGRAVLAKNILGIHMWGDYVNLAEIMEIPVPCEADS